MKYAGFVIILFLCLNGQVFCSDDVISILYFENTTQNQEYQWLHKGLADMLISELSGITGIQIVERSALEKILQEQALGLTGLMDSQTSDQIGEMLQANKLLYGSYIVRYEKIRIDLKISDVSSGQIIGSCKEEGDIDDLFQIITDLSRSIRKALNLKIEQSPRIFDTGSIAALARYYTGLDHLDNQRYEQARDEFLKAKDLDPLYLKAQQGLTESYKFLKAFKIYRQQNEITTLYNKVSALHRRLQAPQWMTFADIVMTPEYQSLTTEEQQEFIAKHTEWAICNTPSQCTWHIMLTYDEIGRKSAEYFGDIDLQKNMLNRVVRVAEKSRHLYGSDPFLSEILYFQIYALYQLKDFERVKLFSEEFLMNYPEYRMIEAVENYYHKALDILSGDHQP